MLVTNVGGLDEIVPNGKVGYAVRPEVSAIAEALLDFFGHHRSEEFKNNIRIEKEQYSWSRFSATMLSLMK